MGQPDRLNVFGVHEALPCRTGLHDVVYEHGREYSVWGHSSVNLVVAEDTMTITQVTLIH